MTDVTIRLGGREFSLSLPDEVESGLHLLEAGAQTADEAYVLARLIGLLKGAHYVCLLSEDGEAEDENARPAFFQALREREMLLAHQLRNYLEDTGASW